MAATAHEALVAMLDRLKLTAICDQLDSLLYEVARLEMTLREALGFLASREIARRDEQRIEMATKLVQFPSARELDGFERPRSPRSTSANPRTRYLPLDRAWRLANIAEAAGDREDATGGQPRARGDPNQLPRQLHHRRDTGRDARQGARHRPVFLRFVFWLPAWRRYNYGTLATSEAATNS